MLRLNISPYEALKDSDEPIVIALDSTGIKVYKSGGWVERIRGKKKRYIKIHFAVNVKTRRLSPWTLLLMTFTTLKPCQSL